MEYAVFCGFYAVAFFAPSVDNVADSLLNTSHLEHLYQEVEIGAGCWGPSGFTAKRRITSSGDEDEGFTCVDDVARALVFYCRNNIS